MHNISLSLNFNRSLSLKLLFEIYIFGPCLLFSLYLCYVFSSERKSDTSGLNSVSGREKAPHK